MDSQQECRWIRSDGREISFPDRATLLARILAGEIGDDDLVRVSKDGRWARAGDLRASVESVLEQNSHPHDDSREPPSQLPSGASAWRSDHTARRTRGPDTGPEPLSSEPAWTPDHASWRRFLARLADLGLAGLLTGAAFGLLLPGVVGDPSNDFWVGAVSLLVTFPFLDAFVLSRWRTSPGKWLLSVRTVRPEGEPIPFEWALSRAYGVVVKGMWLGIPILHIIPLIRAYSRASKDQPQPWEETSRTFTEVAPFGGKVVLYVGLILLILTAIVIDAAASTGM